MLEGRRHTERERYKTIALGVALGINFAFADEAQSAKMLEGLGISTPKESDADVEKRKAEKRKLLRKIETAQIAYSRELTMEEYAKGNDPIR